MKIKEEKSTWTYGKEGTIKPKDPLKGEMEDLKEGFRGLRGRVLENELDLRQVMAYLGVEIVVYKKYRTGMADEPWIYGRKIVKRESLEKPCD